MPPPRNLIHHHHHFLLLLTLPLLLALSAYAQNTTTTAPISLIRLSNPPAILHPPNNNSSSSNPLISPHTTTQPTKVVAMDATHSIYFTQYHRLFPERNYYAAIIAMQTALVADFFQRRAETMGPGTVAIDAYGAKVLIDNPTTMMTYEMAHELLGQVGAFMMQENVCTTKFDLWEVRPGGIKHVSVGWLGTIYGEDASA